jgi:SAM-dependent methyltransferase
LVKITPKVIEEISTVDGTFIVSDKIKNGIESVLAGIDQSNLTEGYLRLQTEYKNNRLEHKPAIINYDDETTLNAYVAYYLPRNTIIPAIAIRDLSYHPLFQTLPDVINVLDIGCGTGAISLGLSSLFEELPNFHGKLVITGVDQCLKALYKQKNIIEKTFFTKAKFHLINANLNSPKLFTENIAKYAPFDFVFTGNCLTEVDISTSRTTLGVLKDLIKPNGAIIMAEAQRNFTKEIIRILANESTSMGLHVFYPCPADSCGYPPYDGYEYCWSWRDHDYVPPDIKIDGRSLENQPRERLTLSWLMLTQNNINIYDGFQRARPELKWGPISKAVGDAYEMCYKGTYIGFKRGETVPFKSFSRGSIVGLSEENIANDFVEM